MQALERASLATEFQLVYGVIEAKLTGYPKSEWVNLSQVKH